MPASCQPPISFFETMECTRYFSTFFSRAASVVHGGVSISPWPLILSAADTHTQRISISWARERMYTYAYTKIPNTRIETSCGKGVDERVSVLMLREGKCRAHQYTRQLGGRNWDNEAPGAHKSAIAHHWHLLLCVWSSRTAAQGFARLRAAHIPCAQITCTPRAQWTSGAELEWNFDFAAAGRLNWINSLSKEDLINGQVFTRSPDCVILPVEFDFVRFVIML